MKKGWVNLFFSVVSVLVLSAGYSAAEMEKKAPSAKKAPAAVSPATGKAAWEEEWERTLAAAKKEGVVSFYAQWSPQTRNALAQAFKDKYGITIEFTPFSRGADMTARASTEKRAGLYLADVFAAGAGSLLTVLKPEGILAPIEPLLILPEVKEGKYWRGGRVPFMDGDKFAVGMLGSIQRYMIYNTDQVKKGEITSWKDVLKPQYKGKITINDPTVTGTGNAVLSLLAQHVWNLEETKGWLRQLIKQQEAVIQRDNRTHIESVARGKYAIGIGPFPDMMTQFIKTGAPIDVVYTKEGTYVTPASGCFGVPTQFAHPNAAKVLVNWLLTKEGQTVFAKSFGNLSMRLDVTVEGVLPIYTAQPGEKLFFDDEADILLRGKLPAIAKEVVDAATK